MPFHNSPLDPAQPHSGRTPEDYLARMEPDIRASLTPQQEQAILALLAAVNPKPAPKLVDLRFAVDLVVSRFYVVLLVGKDRRKQRRPYLPESLTRVGNTIAAIGLLIGMNLLISVFILLGAYLVKSALGIDLFPKQHLKDQLEKIGSAPLMIENQIVSVDEAISKKKVNES